MMMTRRLDVADARLWESDYGHESARRVDELMEMWGNGSMHISASRVEVKILVTGCARVFAWNWEVLIALRCLRGVTTVRNWMEENWVEENWVEEDWMEMQGL